MAGKIVIAADHGGYRLKEDIKDLLKKGRYQVRDVGTFSEESCDYPEYGYEAAKEVAGGKGVRGIVICKSGIGMSMIANKVPGVRAALCGSLEDAVSSRKHNDANVLVLGASRVSRKKALDIVKVWMKTKALKGRHARRVKMMEQLEKRK